MALFDRVRFVGDGSARVPGVGNRDHSRDEWYAHPAELRAQALDSGLFEGVHDKPRPVAPAAIVNTGEV